MTSLIFDPLLAWWAIAALGVVALGAALWLGGRGRALRMLAALVLVGLLVNPSWLEETRERLPDYAILAVDQSESLSVDDRERAVTLIADDIRSQAEADPLLELVEVAVNSDEDGTPLYQAITNALGETPNGRLAGVIAVTDGQLHDAPANPDAIDIPAPVHALIVGDPDRSDRRIVVKQAPAYAIVNDRARFTMTVEDPGAVAGTQARVSLSLDGGEPVTGVATIGEEIDIDVAIRKRGPNVVQIEAEAGEDELTTVNNRAAVNVNGVRDRLRVLLVTGEPHSGARAWRDLLKSDPSVDLVHFVILRDPIEMQMDPTPSDELSLIQFPSDELFVQKLNDFDLIIFDYYKYYQGQVLKPVYFTNINRYVENGGALLIVAGPHFATNSSLYRTPLSVILPARPTRRVDEAGYRPQISNLGEAHPVTADFAKPGGEAERWGRWFRRIDADITTGDILLEDDAGEPLLILDRVSQGRVAMLLSDQAWIWRRGVDGGGPHAELFRRLAHWLMKEPELEEERLRAVINQGVLELERRTTGDAPDAATLISPLGEETQLTFTQTAPGRFLAETEINETGLYTARSNDLSTVAASGPLNPVEFADLRATDELVSPILAMTNGGSVFVGTGDDAQAPQIRRISNNDRTFGQDWIGLLDRNVSEAREQTRKPLAPALLLLTIGLGLLAAAWFREGR